MSITRHLLEQRARVTKAEKAKFARQITRLIKNTGKLERQKVDEMIKLLNGAKADLIDTIVSLPAGAFRRDMADRLKGRVEELMADFRARAADQLRSGQEEFATVGADFTSELIRSQGRTPPLLGIRPEIVENAATRSADLIRSLSDRQVARASDLINRAVLTGDSTFQVAQRMRTEFNKGLSQMETIARTEMLGIHSQVQIAQLRDMALTSPGLKKQWITVRDGRQRPDHDGAHLQSVAVDEPFRVGRDLLQFPRDPGAPAGQVINCRCTMVPDFSEVADETETPFADALGKEDIEPVQVELGGLAQKVAQDVKDGLSNLK